MKAPRRAYRPEVVAGLESRLALSHVAAAADVPHVHHAAERAKVSTMKQPEFTVTWNGSDGTQDDVLQPNGRIGDGRLLANVSAQPPGPATVSIGVPPNAALVMISYQNKSSTTITSATISDTLNPDLTLVAGSVSNATGGVVTTTTEADGVQTVQFNIPGGVAAHSDGYVQFEVQRNA
jgi:hypothetical protein